MKEYDFRIHGRKRMNAILVGNYHFKENKDFPKLLSIIEHSRYLETAQKKIILHFVDIMDGMIGT